MSKTNHRINKDRGEKLGEAEAHRQRRGFKVKVNQVLDLYDDDPDDLFDSALYEDEELVTHVKIKRSRK